MFLPVDRGRLSCTKICCCHRKDLAPGGTQMLGDKASSIHELWDRDPGLAQDVTILGQFPSGQPDGCQVPDKLGCLE